MICRECGKDEEAGLFKLGNPASRTRGIHKHCHSKKIRNYQKNQSAKMRPHAWMQCDDCDEIFAKRQMNGTLAIECFYCKSEEIMTFQEHMEKLK